MVGWVTTRAPASDSLPNGRNNVTDADPQVSRSRGQPGLASNSMMTLSPISTSGSRHFDGFRASPVLLSRRLMTSTLSADQDCPVVTILGRLPCEGSAGLITRRLFFRRRITGPGRFRRLRWVA
jgi:hypothetical protein